jgi:phage shock protein A
MGMCGRLSGMIAASLNTLLDRAEEALVAELVREREEALAAARRYAALAIASERGLGRELRQNRSAAEGWENMARGALAAGREDLARRALDRKSAHENLVRWLEARVTTAWQTTTTARASLRRLEARLAETRCQQRALHVQHGIAAARAECLAWSEAELDGLEDCLREREDELEARV